MARSNARSALRLATIYVVVAALWIMFSDRVLEALVHEPSTLTRLQTVKGIAFVLVTGAMLFGLMRLELHLRAESERREREREARFRALFEADLIGIALWSRAGQILDCNEAFARMVGHPREELVTGSFEWTAIVSEDDHAATRHRVAAAWRDGVCPPFPMDVLRRDGSRLPVLAGFSVLPDQGDVGIGLALDMSAQRELESQLLHAQKMQAVGVLAGGIAHDFNNLLTAILGYAELGHEQAPAGSELSGHLEEIRRAAERASSLTQQVLAFSRRSMLRPRVLDVNEVVRGIEPLLRRLLGEDVEVTLALAPGLGAVRVDPGRLEQVIVNLAVNGRDAMPHGGRLTIETAALEVGAALAAGHPGASAGPHVALAIADTGAGMDAATVARAFEPFFTTKEPGKGTGLGLATVYGIVTQSGGLVQLRSEVDRGTRVTVALPCVPAAAVPGRGEEQVARGRVSGTVLIVEDDDAVRLLALRTLEARGWRVLAAARGEEALRLAEQHPDEIDLLLTDSVMPGLTGAETAARVRALRPDVRVLYMSGYAAELVERGAAAGDPVLAKPFTPRELVSAAERRLEQS